MTSAVLLDEAERDVLPWLKLAEDLRVLNLDVDLKIPQICVMGDQSSGKSSVLEALSGIPFPRGSGLVTRCPIRMVMKRSRGNETWSALISSTKNPEKIAAKNVADLGNIIDRMMRELCVDGNAFSTDTVIVELTSPDACDLTVVDLPGIIRTVTAGQSVAVIEQVNRLIKAFLMDSRTIILAVIPANQDIATVDILERAQQVDPTGERTLGVLTKCDLIGPGNEDEVLAVVNNQRKPLALGYVMVKNRSQKEIVEQVTNHKARQNEVDFFATHPAFRQVSSNHYGVNILSKKLTQLLVTRIKKELVPMKSSVEKMLNDVRAELRTIPSVYKVAKTPADRQKLLVSTTQDFVRHLTDSIRGEYRDRILVRNPGLRLYNSAIKKFEEFQNKINALAPAFKSPEFLSELSVQVEQLRGRELPGFMSSQAFYLCMTSYVHAWEPDLNVLISDITQLTVSMITQLATILLAQYPALQTIFVSESQRILSERQRDCGDKLSELLQREQDPFTLNDFLQQWVNKLRFDRFCSAVETSFESARNSSGNWPALKEEIYVGMRQWYRTTHAISATASAQEMSAILEAYWNLSAKRFVDNACMLVDKLILADLPEGVQDAMYQFIRDDKKLQSFFAESPEIARKKGDLEARKEQLIEAHAKLVSTPSE